MLRERYLGFGFLDLGLEQTKNKKKKKNREGCRRAEDSVRQSWGEGLVSGAMELERRVGG